MNTPEGWPTKEMINAGLVTYMNTRKGVDAKDAMAQIFTDMLAAAPTPPAPHPTAWMTDEWDGTVTWKADEPLCPRPVNGKPDSTTMAECILARECGCTVRGHEYAQEKAQEDEPFAWHYKSPRGQCISFGREESKYLADDEIETPLYTRPDDKLRKAADEATNILLELAARCPPGFTLDKICAAYKNLRAALEDK